MKKILHRIFFNFDDGEDPFLSYLETWKRELPEFEIMLWDKTNLPLDLNEYTRAMTAEKNHAFLSDFFRCWLLKEFGGAYFDADIEVLDGQVFTRLYEELEKTKELDLFIGVESDGNGLLTAHSMASKPGVENGLIDFMMRLYAEHFAGPLRHYIKKFHMPSLIALYFLERESLGREGKSLNGRFRGLMEPIIEDRMKIYPQEYFSPITSRESKEASRIVSKFSPNTCLCHHFAATWTIDSSGTRQGVLFKDALSNNSYAIATSIHDRLIEKYGDFRGIPPTPQWKLPKSNIEAIESFLNFLIPYGTKRYQLLKSLSPKSDR